MKVIIHWSNGDSHTFVNKAPEFVEQAKEWIKNKSAFSPFIIEGNKRLHVNAEHIRMVEIIE